MLGKLATLRVLVDGMTCSSCEQRIERAVGALPGANRVNASAPLGVVMLYHDPLLGTAESVHGLRAHFGRRATAPPALHRHVRRSRSLPGSEEAACARRTSRGRRGGKAAAVL